MNMRCVRGAIPHTHKEGLGAPCSEIQYAAHRGAYPAPQWAGLIFFYVTNLPFSFLILYSGFLFLFYNLFMIQRNVFLKKGHYFKKCSRL
jgi:hypothetical protein